MTRRVLHFTDSPQFGGAEQALLTLIDATDRDRWEVELAYHPSADLEPLAEGAKARGVPLWPVPRMDPGFEGLRRLPRFATDLRRRAPDIVHLHLTWPLGCQYALLATALARHPRLVATVQLHVDLELSWRVRRQQRLYTHAVDRYIAVSRDVKERLVADLGWPADKIVVIHNSIDSTRFERPSGAATRAALTSDPAAPLVLVPARMDPQKGHRHLLAAAASLPDVHFVLAGEGPERADLERLAKELQVDDRVQFLGYRDDIPLLLAACDLMVLPSTFEGLPLSLLEAMAAGTPVVASRIGGVDELVDDGTTGVLVPPGDEHALATAIRGLLDDPERAAKLAEAARAHVSEEFSASTMARRVAAVYDAVLAR